MLIALFGGEDAEQIEEKSDAEIVDDLMSFLRKVPFFRLINFVFFLNFFFRFTLSQLIQFIPLLLVGDKILMQEDRTVI